MSLIGSFDETPIGSSYLNPKFNDAPGETPPMKFPRHGPERPLYGNFGTEANRPVLVGSGHSTSKRRASATFGACWRIVERGRAIQVIESQSALIYQRPLRTRGSGIRISPGAPIDQVHSGHIGNGLFRPAGPLFFAPPCTVSRRWQQLSTMVRNTCRTRDSKSASITFQMLTTLGTTQRRALELLQAITV
jgi:hypothetical protein